MVFSNVVADRNEVAAKDSGLGPIFFKEIPVP